MTAMAAILPFPHRHLLGIEGLSPLEIGHLLDQSETYVEVNRQAEKTKSSLRGRTIVNLFFENSTRTRTSFELAAKRLSADVLNIDIDEVRGALEFDFRGKQKPIDIDFNAVTARVRKSLLAIVHGQDSHVVVPLQGSGTFSVEAAVATVVPRDGHVLVLDNGA